jgi:hypothetical protein
MSKNSRILNLFVQVCVIIGMLAGVALLVTIYAVRCRS